MKIKYSVKKKSAQIALNYDNAVCAVFKIISPVFLFSVMVN